MAEHPTGDELVALALQAVGAPERERLSEHLAGCAACREEYAHLADAVHGTLAAAPSVAPPAGFSGRVLAAMGQPEPARAAGMGGPERRSAPHRRSEDRPRSGRRRRGRGRGSRSGRPAQ